MEDLILSVSSPPDIDLDVFNYWIEGRTAEEASAFKLESYRKSSSSNGSLTYGLEFPKTGSNHFLFLPNQIDYIKYEVDDQYCLYQLLEHFLFVPKLLREQTVCLVPTELQTILIDKYWSLDDLFVREILNRKLINKNRKELEDISESTGLNLRRITRQYDNLKKIFSYFEERFTSHGQLQQQQQQQQHNHHHQHFTSYTNENIYNFVNSDFLLNPALSKKYSCIIFLLFYKFNLSSKKRIQRLPCENLERCGALILAFLCLDYTTFYQVLAAFDPSSEVTWLENLQNGWNFVWKVFPLVDSYELDKQLINNLRDFRAILSGETLDYSCALIRGKLSPGLLRKVEGSSAQSSALHGKLRTIIKSLLQLGANLSQSREFRDLLEDLVTKIAEPLEECGLNTAEINSFLCACAVLEISEGAGRAMSIMKDNSARSIEFVSSSSISVSTPRFGSRNEQLKKDWLRFITFTRLCILQLISTDRKS